MSGGLGDITLTTTTSGDVELLSTTTAAANQVTITSAGDIDGAGVVTADTVDLNAATGIGAATPLELAASTITADTDTGSIDLDNTLPGLVAFNSNLLGSAP